MSKGQKNKTSLPHTSKGNPDLHIDHEVDVEGGTMKVHESVEGEKSDDVNSKESLKQRLSSDKS